MSNELAKMRIVAYKDSSYEKKIGSDKESEFKVLVNPESYSYGYKVDYGKKQSPGSKGKQKKFNLIKPNTLSFDFIFDKTGAIPGTFSSKDPAVIEKERAKGILPDLEKFQKIIIDYKGELHQPPKLMMTWGTLLFKGVALELDINFKLFRPDGTPLRAVVKVKFEGTVENELRVREQNNQSPDITKIRTVKAGDHLSLMAYELYNDPAYYIKIAKANKLVNFRNLKPGQKIFFPPVRKEQ